MSERSTDFRPAKAACVLVLLAANLASAGDFSSPTPYSGSAGRGMMEAREALRLSAGSSGGGLMSYMLGDYYERYQYAANWNNAVLSGNTIILNGDNNSVTLTTDGSTVTQTAEGTCQGTSNTFLNDGGTASAAAGTCGEQ